MSIYRQLRTSLIPLNDKMNYFRYFTILMLLMLAKAALSVFIIKNAGIGLGPDEAQYWTWSQQLDWGYYSKPPGIAWQDGLGTYFFGNTELGVRSIPVAIGCIVPLLIFMLAKACRLQPFTCFLSGLAMAFSPIGMMASFLSITDGGMIFFWTWACLYFVTIVESEKSLSYPVLGLFILGGALFKWPMYALWLFVILFWWVCPRLASLRVLLGIGVSLLALLPSVYWNASHDWVTFRHVFSTVTGGHGSSGKTAILSGYFFEFLGAQALLVFPIFFILLIMAFWWIARHLKEASSSQGVVFCALVPFGALMVALTLALFMKMQGNWGIFAYPTAFVVIAWYACEKTKYGKIWLMAGIILSAILCCTAFAIPFIQSNSVMSQLPIPYKLSPFRHNVGWGKLKQELTVVGYDPHKDFLFGDKYQVASILSFYGPEQKRAYFFNLLGTRKNQFSFWPSMSQEQEGKRGFFVVVENIPGLKTNHSELIERYENLLKPYFKAVRFLGMKSLFMAYGNVVKGAFIFECEGYLGEAPIDPELY